MLFQRVLALFVLLGLALECRSATVSGVVMVPTGKTAVNAVVHLFASDGQYITAFCDSDGSFTLRGIPPGSHLLQAHTMGYYYPEVRVETRTRGFVQAFFVVPNTKQLQTLQEPLVLRPMGEIHYYEKRAPFDIWSIIKSPYGLMIGFSIVVIFVLPKLKVDPEEYKEFQNTIKPASGTGATQQARIQSK